MKIFLDTNVLVAACLEDHEHNARAVPLMQSVHDGRNEGFASAHSLLEMHSILTRMPRSPRVTPAQAALLVADNVSKHFTIVALTAREYGELISRLGRDNIAGGKAVRCPASGLRGEKRCRENPHFQPSGFCGVAPRPEGTKVGA